MNKVERPRRTRLSGFANQPRPLGGVLFRALGSLGLQRRYSGWMAVRDWPELVGETIAEKAEAVRYDDGVLYVAVPDDTWRHQLSLQLETIMKKLRSRPYGRAVERIHLQKGKKRT
jgi:predicted nucleic acid-binding Zn ribbon protein